MRAKIIADIAVIVSYALLYMWWRKNFEGAFTAKEVAELAGGQVVSMVAVIVSMQFVTIQAIYHTTKWIHKGK